MRAVVVREHGPFASAARVEEVPDPRAGAGQVVVDVRAADVNFPDVLVIEGTYQNLPPRPFSPGKAAAGVVSEVGADIRRLRVGDRVLLQTEYGTFAEKVAVLEERCHVMPPDMPFEAAAAMGLAYQTAHFALLDRGGLRAGESVLVTGASGGVGLAAVQLAKALGATVLAGVTSQEKGLLARANGADHVVDLAAADLRENLRAQVFAATDGRGADVVVESVGGGVFDAALRAVAWRGRLVVVGFASGTIPQVRTNYLLLKNIALSGLQWSDYRERVPDEVARAQAELFDLYTRGKLRPHVAETYPLECFADALARFGAREVVGKLVLVP